ncbi:hypothetical protein V6N12_052430 [Hibiscus sabdariffa]|uniref:Coatomer beta subunit appendage platform domain-containing protein n=1 Tax=Hibiscus sabdariffa TaxID=183260 RepID=A0ABR2GJH4_9ROSI
MESGFLAANLYAKSVFGEDALVNLSVEKLSGHIRMRSKNQGIALSLGIRQVLSKRDAVDAIIFQHHLFHR